MNIVFDFIFPVTASVALISITVLMIVGIYSTIRNILKDSEE